MRPSDGPVWVQYGHVLAELGDLSGAGRAYEAAEKFLGANADLRLSQGRLARRRGDHAAATQAFMESRMLGSADAEPELFSDQSLPFLRAVVAEHGLAMSPLGRVEHSAFGAAVGWAVDPDFPEDAAEIEFLHGDVVVASVPADLPRPDLEAAGFGRGLGGFALEYGELNLDMDATITARFARSKTPLSGGTFRIDAPKAFKSWLSRPLRAAPTRGAVREDIWLSIIMPVHDPVPAWLQQAIASVLSQDAGGWELICVDDGSHDPDVKGLLERAALNDDRVRTLTLPNQNGVAAATNAGLRSAQGEWVAFLDHDDLLEPEAVRRLKEAAIGDADLIYSDEAITWQDVNDVRSVTARPAFSYDYYLSHPYFVHLVAVRRKVIEIAGGLDDTLTVSADVDFVLRVIEHSKAVAHIPAILYRWRTHARSLGHTAKSRVSTATVTALRRHLRRTGKQASVSAGPSPNCYRIDWPVTPGRTLAIIPTRNRGDLLEQCLQSLKNTVDDGLLEILIIDHESDDPETVSLIASFAEAVTVMPYEGPFNFARMNNEAVRKHGAGYDRFLFLNNDVQAIEAGWFERLAGLCSRPDVGVAGATLIYPDGRIQHSGVAMGLGGFAEHVHKFSPLLVGGRRNPGPGCAIVATRDVSAVTAACMMVRANVFSEVGGFDETFQVGFNDTDLCLRIGAAGFKVLNDGLAVLIHHESATRRYDGGLRHPDDAARLLERWGELIRSGDPFFSPMASLDPAAPMAMDLCREREPRLRRGLADVGLSQLDRP